MRSSFSWMTGAVVFLQAGVHPVALDLHGKIQAHEDDGDGPDPAAAAHVVGGAALEGEGDVVLVDGVAAVSVQDAVVIAHPGREIEIFVGDDGVTALAEAFLHIGGGQHLFPHHRQEAGELNGAGFPSPHVLVQHPPQEGLEGDRGHLVRGYLMGLGVGPRQAAAQVDEVEVQGNGGVQLQGVRPPGPETRSLILNISV